ncbi:helix-turn-helix domain-containing protein [Dyadobacter helix]|nr:AraC family transcriptional regulator [Dyadobacter sp. CECT 9275]
MKKVYTVQFPALIIPKIISGRKMPVDCLYPIRYADCKQMQWSTGMIIRQRVVTYDFLIELFESRVNEDLQIEVVFNKPCVVFYYGFSGTVICENKESGGLFTLQQGQAGAINVPPGKYHLLIRSGWSTGLLYIFDNKYLDSVLQMAPFDFRAVGLFGIGSSDCYRFPFFMIDSIAQIMMMLQNINPEQRSLSLKMSLFELLKRYGEQLARYKNKPAGEALERVVTVKNFIEAQLTNGPLPTVFEISQQFNIHPDALNRSFKNTFGVSLKKYINQTKMHLAFQLLSQDKMSVQKVSEQTGYGSPFSFSIQFKLYYGFSPNRLIAK